MQILRSSTSTTAACTGRKRCCTPRYWQDPTKPSTGGIYNSSTAIPTTTRFESLRARRIEANWRSSCKRRWPAMAGGSLQSGNTRSSAMRGWRRGTFHLRPIDHTNARWLAGAIKRFEIAKRCCRRRRRAAVRPSACCIRRSRTLSLRRAKNFCT